MVEEPRRTTKRVLRLDSQRMIQQEQEKTRPRINERHSQPTLLSDFILGCQDGLVNVLGILLGLTAAAADTRVFFVAALAALAAESISMGAVAYTSTSARRQVYLKELSREQQEMHDVPDVEREEVRQIFRNWGYNAPDVEDLTERIVKNPKAMLELMMGYELDLAPIDKKEALRSFLIVMASTVAGSIVPLIPYLFVGRNILNGTVLSVIVSGVALFLIGVYEAKTTVGSIWRSGLRMAAIGLTAGLAGFLVGRLIGAVSF